MGTVHFIGGEKGGVGKSLLARLLAQYFIDHGQPFLAFDCDKTHGALMRFYSSYSSPVVIDDYQSLDVLIDSRPPIRRAAFWSIWPRSRSSRWRAGCRIRGCWSGTGVSLELVYWHVMDNGFDSVELLRKLLDEFGQKIKLVLVLNQVRGERFELLEASGQRTRAEQGGARTMSLQRLADATMHKIDAQRPAASGRR